MGEFRTVFEMKLLWNMPEILRRSHEGSRPCRGNSVAPRTPRGVAGGVRRCRDLLGAGKFAEGTGDLPEARSLMVDPARYDLRA
jgi:hypothetical protein